ncbi:MAG: hypothetical protein AAGA45_00570 [Verrucomicrobiota bacterium]
MKATTATAWLLGTCTLACSLTADITTIFTADFQPPLYDDTLLLAGQQGWQSTTPNSSRVNSAGAPGNFV